LPSRGRLSERQVALVQAFFRNQPEGFFLTGGAVLAGWELAHRATDDLDLFTVNAIDMGLGEQALRRAADQLGASLEAISTSPDFRRFVARFSGESVKVDLVRDHAPQLFPKVERDGVRTDSAEEIFVNKICTLVERSEPRDLVDLMRLDRQEPPGATALRAFRFENCPRLNSGATATRARMTS